MSELIQVQVRSNDGNDIFLNADTIDAAKQQAKENRTPDNHMVCIEVSGERIHRWDKNKIVNSNRWRKVDPDEMEVLVPIRQVFRTLN